MVRAPHSPEEEVLQWYPRLVEESRIWNKVPVVNKDILN
jgi:hypothetical protein